MVLRETYRTMTIDHDHDQKLKFKIFRAVCTFAMLSLIVEISYTFTAVLVPLSSYSTFSACPCLDHHMVCPVPYRKVGSREAVHTRRRTWEVQPTFSRVIFQSASTLNSTQSGSVVVRHTISIQPVMCARGHWTVHVHEAAHLGSSNNTLKVQGFLDWSVGHKFLSTAPVFCGSLCTDIQFIPSEL